jgi:uncharacterized protein YbcI
MNNGLVDEMEKKLNRSMEKFGLTRLELFTKIAVKCENFIVFVLVLIRKVGQQFVEKYSKLFQY